MERARDEQEVKAEAEDGDRYEYFVSGEGSTSPCFLQHAAMASGDTLLSFADAAITLSWINECVSNGSGTCTKSQSDACDAGYQRTTAGLEQISLQPSAPRLKLELNKVGKKLRRREEITRKRFNSVWFIVERNEMVRLEVSKMERKSRNEHSVPPLCRLHCTTVACVLIMGRCTILLK